MKFDSMIVVVEVVVVVNVMFVCTLYLLFCAETLFLCLLRFHFSLSFFSSTHKGIIHQWL